MQNLAAQRQLIRETLLQLSQVRKERRRIEAEQEKTCKEVRTRLESLQAPFLASIENCQAEEAQLKELAAEALELFTQNRIAELSAGHECPNVEPPAGVTIRYVERIEVPDVDLLAPSFWKTAPDTAKLKAAHKAGNLPEGAHMVRVPSFVVAGDE